MRRNEFVKGILGCSTLLALDGVSSILKAAPASSAPMPISPELAFFGAVHLNNTSVEQATWFWKSIVGMTCRYRSETRADFGTENRTLVVVHQTAKQGFQKGYSGLYHFAVHAPDEQEFARMLYRLLANNYPCSPTDHTMSKSVYLTDPDGITVEFTLETPERFKRVSTKGGLKMEGTDGTLRPASAVLDVANVLRALPDRDLRQGISNESKIGHLHLYAASVERSNSFYKALGFQQFNYLPQFNYADVGAGGAYQHRIALNSWHGSNKPLAPAGSAGLGHFQVDYASDAFLLEVLKGVPNVASTQNGYWVSDPTGNRILLTVV